MTDIRFGQGSTIRVYVDGNAQNVGDVTLPLTANPFKVLFYLKQYSKRILIDKTEMTYVDVNKYRFDISHDITKTLPVGTYTAEILFGDSETTIEMNYSFTIFETEIKSSIV